MNIYRKRPPLEIEHIEEDHAFGIFLTGLLEDFPLERGGSLELFEDEILYRPSGRSHAKSYDTYYMQCWLEDKLNERSTMTEKKQLPLPAHVMQITS